MGNVAELLVRNLDSKNATPEAVSQAEAWAKKGLEVVIAARKISPIEVDVCEEAFAVLLYNVAMIREVNNYPLSLLFRLTHPIFFFSFRATQLVLVLSWLRVWRNPKQLRCKRELSTLKTRSESSTQARIISSHSWLMSKIPKKPEKSREGTNLSGCLSSPSRCHR